MKCTDNDDRCMSLSPRKVKKSSPFESTTRAQFQSYSYPIVQYSRNDFPIRSFEIDWNQNLSSLFVFTKTKYQTKTVFRKFCSKSSNLNDDDGGGDHDDLNENDVVSTRVCWNCNKQLLIDRSTNGCEQQSPPSSSSSSLPLSSRQVNGIGPEKSAKNSYGMRSLDSIGNSSTIVIICPNCKRIQPLPSDIDYFTLFNLKGNLSSTSSPISSSYRYNDYYYDNKNGHKDQEESTDQKPHRFVESDESLGKDQHQQQPQREQNHSLQPFSLQYRIDLDQLRKEFIRLQQNFHPDMNINRSNIEIEYSRNNAALINEAYQTLRDPYRRAVYMLDTYYHIKINTENFDRDEDQVLDEINTNDKFGFADLGDAYSEPELLLEIMELNEEIEMAANNEESLRLLGEQVEETIAEIIEQLADRFQQSNMTDARRLTIKFSYYRTIASKLKSQNQSK
ncbi:major abundant protein BTP1 [Sarcoptes scabiei]|nr:major abundant protein BTP1 [Sarcoptes scabiei]